MGIDRRLSSREIGQLLRQSARLPGRSPDGRIRIQITTIASFTAQFLTEHVHQGLVQVWIQILTGLRCPIGVTTDRCIKITTGQNVGIRSSGR